MSHQKEEEVQITYIPGYLKYFWIYLKYCCTSTLCIGFDCKMNGNLCAGVFMVVFFTVLFIMVTNDVLLQ